jgi:predicted TIM-barrel fold metal-dependent hydrolase
VGTLLKTLELTYKKMPNEFPEHPLEVFQRNVWVNPFWEESVTGLIDLLGADRVCFGSDFPHPEGLADPLGWVDELDDVPAADIAKIMSSNMFGLLGLTPPVTRAA